VIYFLIASLVLRDFVLGVRLSFKPCWHSSHLLCVARNAHVLSGYVERVTRRQLRIRKNRRGLLGEDEPSEKQQKRKGAQNVHRPVFLGLAEGLGKKQLERLKAVNVPPNASCCSSCLCFRSNTADLDLWKHGAGRPVLRDA